MQTADNFHKHFISLDDAATAAAIEAARIAGTLRMSHRSPATIILGVTIDGEDTALAQIGGGDEWVRLG